MKIVLRIEVEGEERDLTDKLLSGVAMLAKEALLSQKAIPNDDTSFRYSLLGNNSEEQAVASAEIWETTESELRPMMVDAAGEQRSHLRHLGGMEAWVRYLCQQYGGAGVIKALHEITQNRGG